VENVTGLKCYTEDMDFVIPTGLTEW